MLSAFSLLTLLYIAGVVVGDVLRCDQILARTLSLAILLLLPATLLIRPRLRGPARRRFGLVGLLLCGAFSVGIWAQARRPPPLPAAIAQAPEPWRAEGQVVSGLQSSAQGTQFRVAVERLGPLAGRAPQMVNPALVVSISVPGRLLTPLWPGDRLRFAATLRAPDGPRNPGAADRARHFASLGVSAIAVVQPEALLRLDVPFARPTLASSESQLDWLELAALRGAAQARARLLEAMRTRLFKTDASRDARERYGLLAALVLGERGPLYAADAQRKNAGRLTIESSFRDAGIYHILSVSGLHLAVASFIFYRGLCWLLLYIPGLPQRWVARRLAALCALPAVLFYTLLTGAELPTVRAAVAAVLWLLAIACGRRARLLEAVAVAILFIAGPNADGAALLLFDPSLVLSLAATLAIAYLRPLGGLQRRVRAALRRPLRIIDASLAATLITLPLCAYYFAEAQFAGVLGNLLAVPIGELIVLPSGLLGAGLALPSHTLGGPLLDLAALASTGLLRVSELLARLGLSRPVPSPSALQVAWWTLGLWLCAGRRFVLGAGLCAAGLGIYLISAVSSPGELRVTFLDVGQGDAAVLELPDGGVVVIDSGPGSVAAGGRDFGDLVVAPFLRHRGHRRIDLLIASHRHPDHIGGFASLIEQFPVTTLWTPPGERGRDVSPSPRTKTQAKEATLLAEAWQRIVEAATRRGAHIEAPADQKLGAVTLEVVSPCAQTAPRRACTVVAQPGFGENDSSLVLRVKYAGRAILFAGDIELAGELALLDRHDEGQPIDALLLKAPHHCSRTSSMESLITAVSPAWVICSAGRHNRFGFPHREVLDRYTSLGSHVFSTAEQGALSLSIAASGAANLDALIRPLHFPLALPVLQR